MRIALSLLAVLAGLLAPALPARAGDDDDLKESQAHFEKALKSMNDRCKTNITATYDLKNEKYERERYDSTNKKWFFEPNRTEGQFRLKKGFGYDLCACAFQGIEQNCDKDTFKEMIAAKVRTIQCEHRYLNRFERELSENWDKHRKAPPGYDQWEVSVQNDGLRHEYKDGVLKTFVDPDGSNCGSYTSKFVTKKLGFEEEEGLKESRARFEEELAKMNEKCGTSITATYDLAHEKYERERWDSANKRWFFEPNPTGGQFQLKKGWGYGLCSCAFKGIADNCDKDAFKAMIAKKVKSIECEHRPLNRFERELHDNFEKTHKDPPGYDLWEYYPAQMDSFRHEYKNGVLKTYVDPDGSNCGAYTSKFVTRKLGFNEEEGLKAARARFDEALASMNEKCGTKIDASYDFASEKYERERYDSANKKWFFEPNPTGGQFKLQKGYGYDLCTCAFKGIEQSCGKDSVKAAVARKIKSIRCEHKFLNRFEGELSQKFDKTHKVPAGYERWEVESGDRIRHEYKGGVLRTFVDPDESNCGQYTSRFLTSKIVK